MFDFKHYRSNKEVDAAKISETVTIGGVTLNKDDYVVKNPNGELTTISQKDFEAEFTRTRQGKAKSEAAPSMQSAPVAETVTA